jgi:protein tyrosine phosphatase (PTP) superfamily phosphohydrolase (DUF442 family)
VVELKEAGVMKRTTRLVIGTVSLAALAAGCGGPRPQSWARKVRVPGLRNFHKVDDGLYRSARLSSGSAADLKKLGIRTIVNLDCDLDDDKLLAGTGIKVVNQPCHARGITDEHLAQFLKVAIDPKRRPVLVHCWAGADRTGAMVAAYRVVVQHWSREDALREMRRGGFSQHFWLYPSLARTIRALKVEKLRSELGTEAPPPPKIANTGTGKWVHLHEKNEDFLGVRVQQFPGLAWSDPDGDPDGAQIALDRIKAKQEKR